MGQAPGQSLLPATRPEDPAGAQVVLGDALEVALQQNLGLRTRRAELEAAEREVRDAQHALLPTLSTTLSAGVGSQQSNRDGGEVSAWGAVAGLTGAEAFPNIGVSGQLSVPLGNRGARGEVDRSEANALARRTELAEAERQLAVDVAAQVATLEAAQARIALAEANVRLAEQSLAAEEARFAEGHSLTRDLLAARAELQRVRGEAARALVDRRLAMNELQRLLGVL
jgi:outer membrane protein TolC